MTPETVLATVDAVMSRPFAWGGCDCATAACDVYLRLHGVDLLAPWRGQWTGAASAGRLILASGGPLACAEKMAQLAGLIEGAAPGGIGIAGRTLMICIAPGQWAGKTKMGFGVVRAVDKAWHA